MDIITCLFVVAAVCTIADTVASMITRFKAK